MDTIKTSIYVPHYLWNDAQNVIPAFIKGMSHTKIITNALINVLLTPKRCLNSNNDEYRARTNYLERNNKTMLTFSYNTMLLELVKEKYGVEDKSITNIIIQVLKDAVNTPFQENSSIPPLFGIVGNKNEEMVEVFHKIVMKSDTYNKSNIYVEPFCGTCSLFLSLPLNSNCTYILNDLNKNIVNIFRVLIKKPLEFFYRCLDYDYDPNDYNANGVPNSNERLNQLKAKVNSFQLNEHAVIKNVNYYSIDSAVDYLVYRNIRRNKTGKKTFCERLPLIFRISKKLNSCNAKFLCKDGIEIIKKYNNAGAFIVIDSPYINSEQYYSKIDDFKNRHSEIAKVLYQYKGNFVYFNRKTYPLAVKINRGVKDKIQESYIEDFFFDRGFYSYDHSINEQVTECIITNFETGMSTPYE